MGSAYEAWGAVLSAPIITVTTLTMTDTCDSLYRLTNATYTTGSVFTYTLDVVGQRTAVSETLRQPDATLPTTAIAYTYDPLYRLANATYNTGSVVTYTCDTVDNCLGLTNTTLYGGWID